MQAKFEDSKMKLAEILAEHNNLKAKLKQTNLELETKQIELKSTTLTISKLDKDLEFSNAKYVDLKSELESIKIINLNIAAVNKDKEDSRTKDCQNCRNRTIEIESLKQNMTLVISELMGIKNITN